MLNQTYLNTSAVAKLILIALLIVGCAYGMSFSEMAVTRESGHQIGYNGFILNETMTCFIIYMLDHLKDPRFEGYDVINEDVYDLYAFKYEDIRSFEDLTGFLESELNISLEDDSDNKIIRIRKQQ